MTEIMREQCMEDLGRGRRGTSKVYEKVQMSKERGGGGMRESKGADKGGVRRAFLPMLT